MSIRLIETSSLRMKVFVGDKIPEYAILSHTWSEDSEIDFREMQEIVENPAHPARQRSGYHKILKTCEIARTANIKHVWIDTCCIDKTSSAELSEAINSMFKWYRNAKICYAYLFDLPVGCDTRTTIGLCRYWLRGFTLQE